MTDSISVIGPGWRATDSDNSIVSSATLYFFDAGTTDARTVYSDSSLSTSLGTSVGCNAGGYPVTSGNNRTLIYTGNTAYKVRLEDSEGSTVWEHDNVLGALDTSSFLTSAAVADQSVVAVTDNRSVTTADKGKLLDVDCSGAVRTMTFAAAVTLGDGFFVGVRHNGTANQVEITGDGTDTFGYGEVDVTGFALVGRGQTVWITCNGANFKVNSEIPPLIGATTGVIKIADRLSDPPGSPDAGARYIVTSSPTGDWSGFAEHDIAEADGQGGWFNYTPATDCGWLAYVQDEDDYYAFSGSAWVLTNILIDEATPSDLTSATDGKFPDAETIWNEMGGALESVVDATNGGANDLTEIDFTGIAANAKRITVLFDQVSLDAGNNLLVQIGDAGGIETSGYVSGSDDRNGGSTSTAGFVIHNDDANRNTTGILILELMDASSNLWISSHSVHQANDQANAGGGRKALSATLDRVRITRATSGAFDAGQVAIRVEYGA